VPVAFSGCASVSESTPHLPPPSYQYPGQHTIVLEVLAPYSGKSQAQVQLGGLPECSKTTLDYTIVDRQDIQVTVEPSLETNVVSQKQEGSLI
jgi:hypothetical protein